MSAREILNFVQSAAGELGYEIAAEFEQTGKLWDKKNIERIKNLKKRGVRDIGGALGDELYNDKDYLSDFLGDKIYEEGSNREERIKLINELKEMQNFDSWKEALNELEESMI